LFIVYIDIYVISDVAVFKRNVKDSLAKLGEYGVIHVYGTGDVIRTSLQCL